MKKIFTLLLCLVALSAAADNDDQIQQCINALLQKPNTAKLLMANPDLDANHDGVLTIADVTTLIDLKLQAQAEANRAPAKQIDIDELAGKVIRSTTGEPNITDLNDAIDSNLKNK